jgi:hypothetical protein
MERIPSMAKHEVPDDGTQHVYMRDCPCKPRIERRRGSDRFVNTVFVHQEQPADAPAPER